MSDEKIKRKYTKSKHKKCKKSKLSFQPSSMPSIENNKLGYANSHRSLISTHKLPISLVLGKVVDLCCVASSVSHILSFSAKDYLKALVWKKKSQLIENIYKENNHISANQYA